MPPKKESPKRVVPVNIAAGKSKDRDSSGKVNHKRVVRGKGRR